MGYCIATKRGVKFESYVKVYGNPNATITLASTDGKYTYRGVCSSNGDVTITVNKKATYNVSTSLSAAFSATGNTTSISVSNNKTTYYAQMVKLNRGTNTLKVSNEYASGELLVYTGSSDTRPSSIFSGYVLRYRTDTYPTSGSDGRTPVTTGDWQSYKINTSTTVWGMRCTASVGTTYYFALFATLTIGGTTYYSPSITASGSSKTMSATVTTVTATKSVSVPTGMHTLNFCVIGGGGGGGHNGGRELNYGSMTSGAGGGEGGAMTTGTISVVPGQSISCVIGAGGSGGSSTSWAYEGDNRRYDGAGGSKGGSSSVSINGSTYTAVGGNGGGGASGTTGGGAGSGAGNGGDGGWGFSGNAAKTDSGGDGWYNHGSAGTGGTGPSFNGVVYSGGGGGGGMACERESSGSAATYYTYATSGNGGTRGGGAGGGTKSPVAGTANTGGGGGGGGSSSNYSASASSNGAAGGSGVVILKFTA